MGKLRDKDLMIAAAKRGYIVQRVLVDGWSVRQAAGAFGVDERAVTRWVSAYRRRGMASLRSEDIGTESLWRRLVLALRLRLPPMVRSLHQLVRQSERARCIVLRQRDDALRR